MRSLISNIRFPLCVLIVFMHCDPPVFCESIVRLSTYREFNLLHGFLYESLFRLCVPIFFIISGYLFFINIDQFTKGVYCEKLHRRLHSLLIPYLVWNGVVFLLYYLGSMTIAPMPSGKAATSFSFSDFIWSFWNIGHVYGDDSFTGLVLDIPLWYVRDLMVISLLSPLLYLLLTKTKGFILLLFAVLWAGELIPDFYAPSDQALFFFSLGAYAGIRKFVIPVEWGDKRCYLFLLIYLLLAVPILYFRFFRSFEVFWVWIKHVNDLFGIATILLIALRLTQKKESWLPSTISGSSFFLYAFFSMPLLLLQKLIVPLFESYGSKGMLACFLICPTMVIALGLICYWCLKRVAPAWLSRLFTGGR